MMATGPAVAGTGQSLWQEHGWRKELRVTLGPSLPVVDGGQVRPQEIPGESTGILAGTACRVQPTEGLLGSWVLQEQELRGVGGGEFGALGPWLPAWGAV